MRSLLLVCFLAATAHAKTPRWETLPHPPKMPAPVSSGSLENDGAKIFYADYGTADDKRPPVILLHGGLGNSDHFGFQMPVLVDRFRVIVIDSRGQGRSTLPKAKLSYHAMATDVAAVMDVLEVPRASFAGWSDGGAIALDMAITMPERVERFFIIGTDYNGKGTKPKRTKKSLAVFNAYLSKCRADQTKLRGTSASWQTTVDALLGLWKTPAGLTPDALRTIKAPALIALGSHDEIIARDQVEDMGTFIPNARVRIFADTSHFAMWQDPDSVNKALVEFLSGN